MSQPAGLAEYSRALSKTNQADQKDGTDDAEPSFNSRFEDIKEIWQNGEILTVTKTQSQFKRSQEKKKRFGEFSLLLRRIMDLNDPRRVTLQLELQSDIILRQQFRRFARRITSISLHHTPIVIQEPYPELYHCRKAIRDEAASTTDESVRQELQLLIDFEMRYMADTIATIEAFKNSGTIEFIWLWGIFKPGCQVVVQNTSATAAPIEWCGILKSYTTRRDESGAVWVVTVTHTCFNGQKFGTGETVYQFHDFPGTIAITQLPLYPLEYHMDKQRLIDAAVESGEMFERYCRASAKDSLPPVGTTMVYEGPFWTLRSEEEYSRRGCRMHDTPSGTVWFRDTCFSFSPCSQRWQISGACYC